LFHVQRYEKNGEQGAGSRERGVIMKYLTFVLKSNTKIIENYYHICPNIILTLNNTKGILIYFVNCGSI